MCDPLSIGGAVLSVAGTVAQHQGAKKAASARSAAASAEDERQAALDRQSQQTFGDTLSGFDRETQDERLTQARDRREDAVNRAMATPDPAVPVTGSAPSVVKGTIAKALSDAMATGRQRGAAQGALSGYGDLSFGNNINLGRSGMEHARIGNFSQRSSAILPWELEAANRKGAGARQFGQLLSSAGMLAGLGGAMGMGPSFGDLFGPNMGWNAASVPKAPVAFGY